MIADILGEQGLIMLVVVVVVLFGGAQIPKLARSLGSAQREFKKGRDQGGGALTTPDKPNALD
jgi:sec-independent protein translocase protein TatA